MMVARIVGWPGDGGQAWVGRVMVAKSWVGRVVVARLWVGQVQVGHGVGRPSRGCSGVVTDRLVESLSVTVPRCLASWLFACPPVCLAVSLLT